MHLHIVHRFAHARRDDVERLYMLDDEFNRATFAAIGYDRQVVEQRQDGTRLVRVLRVVARGAVPAPFAAFAPGGFAFEEGTDYDLARHAGTWRTVPSVLSERFRCEGTFAIEEAPGEVVFRLEGEVVASLPLVGGRAERYAAATAESQHARIAQAVRERLRVESSRSPSSPPGTASTPA